MNQWISVKEKLPPVSYVESDDLDVEFESYQILLFNGGSFFVGYLCQEQDETKWGYGSYYWESYIPSRGRGCIIDIDFEGVSHWMPLPQPPEKL